MSNDKCSLKLGVFQSGQMGQTVNLLSFDFGGSNPSAPTLTRGKRDLRKVCARRVKVLLSQLAAAKAPVKSHRDFAEIAQSIEH